MQRTKYVTTVALATLMLFGCGDDEEGASLLDGGDLVATMPVDLTFVAMFGDAAVACGTDYTDVGTQGSTVQLADARLYVSNVRLVDELGEEVPVELTNDGMWQSETTVLLDFEDGSGRCSGSGTAETNDRIVGMVPEGVYTGVRFDVGVPADENHLDHNIAPPPLNITSMHWVWRNGYKFTKIDLAVDGVESTWNFHLGSTGGDCVVNAEGNQPPGTPPAADCPRQSRPTIELELDPMTDQVFLDLAQLYATADVADGTIGCMSTNLEDDNCGSPFAAVGLSVDTGNCENNCDGQSLFAAEVYAD